MIGIGSHLSLMHWSILEFGECVCPLTVPSPDSRFAYVPNVTPFLFPGFLDLSPRLLLWVVLLVALADILLSLVRSKAVGHLRDVRRLVVVRNSREPHTWATAR